MKPTTEKLSRLVRDRRGNFGLMAAILLPVLLGAGGISIDVTKMIMTKTRLQDATDSAALAAASALANKGYSVEKAKLLAMQFLASHMREGSTLGESAEAKDGEPSPSFASTIDIQESATGGTGKAWAINVTSKVNMDLNPLTRLLIKDKATITASTSAESATESKSAISMYLVLDKSGSMLGNTDEKIEPVIKCMQYDQNGQNGKNKSPCYVKKIEKLKTAAGGLFDYLNSADPSYQKGGNPSSKYVRTGTVAYDSSRKTAYDIAWGTEGARAQVNDLVADGGTSSTAAMQAAYDKLKDPAENSAHNNVNQQVPTKYIVFMTDGNNNNSSDNGKTEAICKNAREADIVIFSIAFMAPQQGKTLLRNCAGDDSRFFAPNDSAGLTAAFVEIGQQAAQAIARLTH